MADSTGQRQTGAASGAQTFSGTNSTSQRQTNSASGAQNFSGSATSAQVQTSAASGAQTISGTATASQAQRSALAGTGGTEDAQGGMAGHNRVNTNLVVDYNTRRQNQVILATVMAAVTQGILE